MIFKFLAFSVIIFLVYIVFFKKNRGQNTKNNNDEITDTMVECPTCKTFVSKDDAIISNGKYFCSKDCLK